MKSKHPIADNGDVKRWRRDSGEKKLALNIVGETMLSVTSRSDKVRAEALESIESPIFEYWCKLAGVDKGSLLEVLKDPIKRASMKRRLEEMLGEDL